MSRDRVHFSYNDSVDSSASRKAFTRAFGVGAPRLSSCGGGRHKTIICRPSQFARFLIYRNEEGGKNGFKILNAKLKPSKVESAVIDVSCERHRHVTDEDDC